jgi:hypothetical protein
MTTESDPSIVPDGRFSLDAPYRFGVLTECGTDPELTRIIADGWAALRDLFAPAIVLEVVWTGADGEQEAELSARGFKSFAGRDVPRGARWNQGIDYLRSRPLDALLLVEANGIVDGELVSRYVESLLEGYQGLGLFDLYLLHPQTGQAAFWTGHRGDRKGWWILTGACLSRDWLDTLNWSLWPTEAESLEEPLTAAVDALATRGRSAGEHRVCGSLGWGFGPLVVREDPPDGLFDQVGEAAEARQISPLDAVAGFGPGTFSSAILAYRRGDDGGSKDLSSSLSRSNSSSVQESEDTSSQKPKMLFLSGPWNHIDTVRRVGLVDPVQTLLTAHFRLTTVPGDQDYGALVERYQPDVVMFDGGCDGYTARSPIYTNTHCRPDIPKIAYVRQDFHSPMRLSVFGRMEAWGVECFFSPSYPYLGAPKAWRDRVIFIPRWVDVELMRDYGETKSVPVSMLGAGFFESDFYPWRRRVAPIIAKAFPYFHAPRPIPEPHMIVGEHYGRMINRSLFTLGCGGASRSLVSKLFEIPGARSVLVTEDTAILRDAGFIDGQNCVLTDAEEVEGRIRSLLNHPEELSELTERGHRFVMEHHTHLNRDQISQWLALRKTLPAGHRIIQESCTAPLRTAPDDFQQTRFVPFETSEVTQGVRDGYEALAQGDYSAAESAFERTLAHYNYMLEAHLGMGISMLSRGDISKAVSRFSGNSNFQTGCHAVVRDPVNQAYLALTYLCGGELEVAIKFAARAPNVRHPALSCVRWILAQARRAIAETPPFNVELPDERRNLNSLDPRELNDSIAWLSHFRDILAGCGQGALVNHISACHFSPN